jgi:hypothetical protein
VAAASALCAELASREPTAALGQLVCCLVRGEPFDRTLDLAPDAAAAAFKSWIEPLWRSRETALLEAFADAVPSVLHVFPWLPEHLRELTRRLGPAASSAAPPCPAPS